MSTAARPNVVELSPACLPTASDSEPTSERTERPSGVTTISCSPPSTLDPDSLDTLHPSSDSHIHPPDRQDPILALPAHPEDDFDAQSTRSEALPKYGDIARERPPRYHVHARASSSTSGGYQRDNEPTRTRRRSEAIVNKKLHWLASFGLAGKLCIPELRFHGLWRIAIVYHFIAALSAVTFIARDLMMIQEWVPILIPVVPTDNDGGGAIGEPVLKSGYDPFPVMRIVILVFWCPVSFRAFATLIQKQIVNYRITLTGVIVCYFGEIFTTVVQLTSVGVWIRRDPAHNGTTADSPNWNAQSMLEMSLWIRLALIIGFHNIGMWFSLWAAIVFPNSNMDVATDFVADEEGGE